MQKSKLYVGIEKDVNGGMTEIGKLIRDAKVFALIDDNETCEGWDISRLDALLLAVNKEWDKYSCSVTQLPEALAKRHSSIHAEAIRRAKTAGWSGENELDEINE